MATTLTVLSIIAVLLVVYLNLVAWVVILRDDTLTRLQKLSQSVIVFLVPFFGACLAMKLAYPHLSKEHQRFWLPWPANRFVRGGEIKRYRDAAIDWWKDLH